jgi:hypothetical protein
MREMQRFGIVWRCRDSGMLGCEHYGRSQQCHVKGACRDTKVSVARYSGVGKEVVAAVILAQAGLRRG